MAKGKQRQALALAARHPMQISLPGFAGTAVQLLEDEAARIVAEDSEKRLNGGVSGHIVASGGRLSGVLKDGNTTFRFAGGQVAVTTHD